MPAHADLEHNYTTLQRLINRAQATIEAGQLETAAVEASVAACYATANHAGVFASARLEGLLSAIGRHIASGAPSYRPRTLADGTPAHVLHVLTEAAGIGGHTRMVWRWISQDAARTHSVILTRQGFVRIPQAMRDAVRAAGGKLYVLNDRVGTLLTWARALRTIAARADLIVLHTYTDDVIPTIAFADPRGIPPVVLLDHSDHKFWVGASVSWVVASQRSSGALLAARRRGVDPERRGLIPVTITPVARQIDRAEARRQIGVPPEATLLLSIARSSKFRPLKGERAGLNDLILPDSIVALLDQHPSAHLIVIGPEHDQRWEQASRRTGGRVRALGRRYDTATYYQAADIYLDSFPFTSITSILEAASYGLPAVALRPYHEPTSHVLCADTPALESSLIYASDGTEYRALLSDLILDPGERARRGAQLSRRVLAIHSGDGWLQGLYALYRQAMSSPAPAPLPVAIDLLRASELDILSLEIDRTRAPVESIVRDHLRLYPLGRRVQLWAQERRRSATSPTFLLPEWLGIKLIKSLASLRQHSK